MTRDRRAWRIVKARRAETAFDGEGSRLFGGRWNSPGVRMAYASSSIALALLETLVNADRDELSQDPYVAIPIDIPSSVAVRRIAANDLPEGWRSDGPTFAELRAIGDRWIRRGRDAVLIVPSAVLPQESNVLINPAHKDMKRLRIGTPVAIFIDGRLVPREGDKQP